MLQKPASNKVASNARCKGNGSLMRRLLELQRFADENVILPEDVSGKILRILTMGRPHSGLQQTVACVLTVSLREFREGQAAGWQGANDILIPVHQVCLLIRSPKADLQKRVDRPRERLRSWKGSQESRKLIYADEIYQISTQRIEEVQSGLRTDLSSRPLSIGSRENWWWWWSFRSSLPAFGHI